MDIILGRARRIRSDEEKRAIVAETMIDGESVSGVARRHGVNVNMLFTWRKRFRLEDEAAAAGASVADFVPVAIGDSVPVREIADRPVIVLDFESGARLRIFGAAASALVKTVIEAMTR
jgi:transposase